jgi:hypothetical protein
MNSQSEKTPRVDVEGLVWAMLDEQISEEDFGRLDKLLSDDQDARRLYLQCVQLHVDLANFFATKDTTAGHSSVGLPLGIPLPTGDATFADPVI